MNPLLPTYNKLTKFESTTPRKINMEHNHGGLEDYFSFQMGDL